MTKNLFVFAVFAIAHVASLANADAATYYVAKTGSDSYSCGQAQAVSTPKLTIINALACLSAGDTLLVRAGTYVEGIDGSTTLPPSGTSWSSFVRIAAYPGIAPYETVWMSPSGGNFVIGLSGTQKYIEFDGINLDSTNTRAEAVKLSVASPSENPHHIRIKNAELRGHPSTNNGSAAVVLLTGGYAGMIGGNELINLRVSRANGAFGAPDLGEGGFYIQSPNNVVDRCVFFDIAYFGIQNYNGYGFSANNNTYKNLYFRDPYRRANQKHAGLVLYSTNAGVLAYNILIRNYPVDGFTAGIDIDASNVAVYNATIYNVAGYGLRVNAGSNNVVKNVITFGNSTNYSNSGSSTVTATNLIGTDPSFVNAASDDFHLQAGSAARDTGTAVGITTDIEGLTRPENTIYDIGAYEYHAAEASSKPAAPTNVRIVSE